MRIHEKPFASSHFPSIACNDMHPIYSPSARINIILKLTTLFHPRRVCFRVATTVEDGTSFINKPTKFLLSPQYWKRMFLFFYNINANNIDACAFRVNSKGNQ
mmetsp:Transcript_20006/g.34429  ORF Transcript_20006/g.34429 Transcript_20006/m.34429 type:complete len:103 (-) Transcript_20006:325-633(-)